MNPEPCAVKAGAHVLVDTNVIIEAHRTECWNALVGHYELDTVRRCVEECATGNQRLRNPVPIDIDRLEKAVNPKSVEQKAIVSLLVECPESADLDPGEKELLAYAFSIREQIFLLCSPDRACMAAIYELGWIERYVSLEELAQYAGVRPNLAFHFTKKWIEGIRTHLAFGELD